MTRIAVLLPVVLLLALAPAQGAGAKSTVSNGVRVSEGIVYGQGRVMEPRAGSADLLLDLFEPAKEARRRRPAIVLIHGGGFTGGSRGQREIVRVARGLAKRGMVVANIDYRLVPQDPVPSKRVAPVVAAAPDAAIFRAMVAAVDDTLTAMDWLRHRARRLSIDPDRLGLVGSSAGAITADHVAYILDDLGVRAPRVRFVGDLWGGIFISPGSSGGQGARQLERGEAPLFAVHGTADTTVPVFLDDALVARARAVGVRVKYIRVKGAAHSFGPTRFFTREIAPGETAFDRMLDFAASALHR